MESLNAEAQQQSSKSPANLLPRLDVRNCEYAFKCPMEWDALSRTRDDLVRHCASCNRDVHYCETDAEMVKHARAGHCVARRMPVFPETFMIFVGKPAKPVINSSEDEARYKLWSREQVVTEALKDVNLASRDCPQCGFPVADYRRSCKVCGYEVGRIRTSAEQS